LKASRLDKVQPREEWMKGARREPVIYACPIDILESLRKLSDDTVYVNELRDEKDRIVEALLEAFFEVILSIPEDFLVNPELLPGEASDIDRLSVRAARAVELNDHENRDLLFDVINDVFPKVRH
jgi:hypothetical protein